MFLDFHCAFADKVPITALLDEFGFNVVMEKLESLRVIFTDDLSSQVLVVVHEDQASYQSKVCHYVCGQ